MLVEFALVMPVLFLILFGMIEFGLNINDYQSLRQADREGARDAVVADYGTDTSCTLTGVTASTTPETNAKKVMCKVKSRSGLDVRVKVQFIPPVGTPSTTNRGTVKVCAARKASSITGLLAPFLKNVNLTSRIEMRAEKDLNNDTAGGTESAKQLTTLAETDPSGRSWSWC